MNNARIAFICEKPENMFHIPRKEDEALKQYLLAGGLNIETRGWNEPDIDWNDFDIVLLKSPFDYHRKPEAFNRWLKKMEGNGIRLINPYHLIAWNANKHYLKEISDAGFKVIPSFFVEKGGRIDFPGLYEQFGTDKLIVKPCVSGGSKNTFTVKKDSPENHREIVQLLQTDDFIVQPFINEIKDGECSLLFFNGQYSHSIIKKPREGDFRVQPQYGGTIHPNTPDHAYIHEAEQLLKHFAEDAFYARVDGVIIDGAFVLMELELIEPILYLAYTEEGYSNYFKGLKAHI